MQIKKPVGQGIVLIKTSRSRVSLRQTKDSSKMPCYYLKPEDKQEVCNNLEGWDGRREGGSREWGHMADSC